MCANGYILNYLLPKYVGNVVIFHYVVGGGAAW